MTISQAIQIRWADVDANRHLRHSVYYDYAASMRMAALSERGLTTKKLEEFMIGPVLFREEAIFRREIVFEDQITIDLEVLKATADYGRFSIRHNITKKDGTLAAIVNVDIAWIDLVKRKLALPNEFMRQVFDDFPRAQDFQIIIPEKKAH
jgi:acyl-CoA thioester hydrolase